MKENYIKQSPMLTLPSLGGGVNSTLVRIGGPTGNFWFAYLDSGQGDEHAHAVETDSNGNIYMCGKHPNGAVLVKWDTDGNVLWQIQHTGNMMLEWQGVAIDSTNNVWVTGSSWWITPPGGIVYRVMTAKYNSNGTLLQQKRFSTNSNPAYGMKGYGISVGSNNEVYVGYQSEYPANPGGVIKNNLSSSWSAAQLSTEYATTCTVNPNHTPSWGGDIGYTISLSYNNTSGFQYGTYLIAQFDSNLSIQWSILFGTGQGDGATTEEGHDVVSLATNGELVVGCTLKGKVASYDAAVAKFSATNGTFIWGRMLGHSSDHLYSSGVALDSDGNVYSLIINQTQYSLVIAKWNASGTLQWQREIDSAGVEYGYGQGIAVDNNGAVIITAISAGITGQSGGRRSIVFKLPDDGSLTGTHGDFTYSISNYTESTTVGHASSTSVWQQTWSMSMFPFVWSNETYTSNSNNGTITLTSM